MKIDREKFLMLSLSMSVSLGCQKQTTTSAVEKAQNDNARTTDVSVDSADEGYAPTVELPAVGAFEPVCEGVPVNGKVLGYDPESECFVACGAGEQDTCYDTITECTEWNAADECTYVEMGAKATQSADGCTRWDSSVECIEFGADSYNTTDECILWSPEDECIQWCEEYSPENECLVISGSNKNIDPTWECMDFSDNDCIRYWHPKKLK